MRITREELVNILEANYIHPMRYSILESNESLIQHNGEWYTPSLTTYFESWEGEPNIIDDNTLIHNFIGHFDDITTYFYFMLGENGKFDLRAYFSVSVHDIKIGRRLKLNKLLIKTKKE